MGDIGSSHTASQKTENYQSGADHGGVASSVRGIGKGGSFAAGSGISLVLSTGGNKTTATKSKGGKKAKANNRGGAAASPDNAIQPGAGQSGPDSQAVNGSGAIKVNISQTDQGAVQAGTDVSLAAIDAVKAANEASLNLAQSALQAGADVASVAIPTYAAAEIAGQAINPQPANDQGQTQTQPETNGQPNNKTLITLGVIAGAVVIGMFSRK